MGPFGARRAASSARRARLPRHGVIVSTRPDDESNDKPDGDDAPGASNDDASREERVRGGFHQADSSRPGGSARSRKDKDDGTSDEPRRLAGRDGPLQQRLLRDRRVGLPVRRVRDTIARDCLPFRPRKGQEEAA